MSFDLCPAETIVAISSPPGKGGVAVLRMSGPRVAMVVEEVAGTLPAPRMATLRSFRAEDGDVIDRGLVLWFPGPGSFTGEDCAEFHVHGGRAVQRDMLSRIARIAGCRVAQAGEFALRAFRNGKFDLTEAEGLADLIEADTSAQRRQALNQAVGVLGKRLSHWRAELVDLLASIEAELDFSDEGDVSFDVPAWRRRLEQLIESIKKILVSAQSGERLREGFVVALAGAPNVGKSSLLNALAQRDVALVSPHPGTTRDIIEVSLELDGLPIVVLDTAGLREASDPVEQEGIKRTRVRASGADLVLWLSDNGEPPEVIEAPVRRVATKIDIKPADSRSLGISVRTGQGLDLLIADITAAAKASLGAGENAVVVRERHRTQITMILLALRKALVRASHCHNVEVTAWELVAEDLRWAAKQMAQITGRVESEEVLGAIFGRFCIGK